MNRELLMLVDAISREKSVDLEIVWTVIPFLILLFRQASRSFPHELLEAARVDGLNEISIFTRIYLPTMRARRGPGRLM